MADGSAVDGDRRAATLEHGLVNGPRCDAVPGPAAALVDGRGRQAEATVNNCNCIDAAQAGAETILEHHVVLVHLTQDAATLDPHPALLEPDVCGREVPAA